MHADLHRRIPIGPAHLAAATVLLVTGDAGLASTVRRAMLEVDDEQVEVIAVPTLDEGMAAHAWRSFDVALLDLPDPTDLKPIEELRGLEDPPVVLVLTEHPGDASALTAIRAGAEDVLAKQRVNTAALSRVVRFAAERRDARTAVDAELDRLRDERTALERFTHEAVHDLKQPLTTIRGMAGALEMKLSDRMDDEDRRLMARLQASVGRVVLIVDDLLDRAREPDTPVTRTRVDLARVVEEVLDLYADALADRGFRTEVGPLPAVWSSGPLVQRIVENLVSNAWKYAGEEPSPVLRIRAEADGDGVVLVVEDNGPGIPVARREQVLRWGVRGEGEREAGDGVGLAASRVAANRLGGKLWVDASALGGAAVRLLLPARIGEVRSVQGGPASR